MLELREHQLDFGDGGGSITFFSRRLNAREGMMIEQHRKLDQHGNLANHVELVVNTFLIRAKDQTGQRLFQKADDIDRVWTKFDPEKIGEAVQLMAAAEDSAGN